MRPILPIDRFQTWMSIDVNKNMKRRNEIMMATQRDAVTIANVVVTNVENYGRLVKKDVNDTDSDNIYHRKVYFKPNNGMKITKFIYHSVLTLAGSDSDGTYTNDWTNSIESSEIDEGIDDPELCGCIYIEEEYE